MASAINASALIASLAIWENCGYAASLFVVIGCAGEAIHEFWPRLRKLSPWWDTKGGKASALLLIAALATEIPIQLKVNSISGLVIAELSREASADMFALENLHQRVVWRTIRPEAQRELVLRLSRCHGSVTIGFLANDRETAFFASQLEDMFEQANSMTHGAWEIHLRAMPYPSDSLVFDIHVPELREPATGAVRDAMSAVGIPIVPYGVPTPWVHKAWLVGT
jgi:hypothetical protein